MDGLAGRPSCRASPVPGRTSPTTSILLAANLTTQVRNIAEVTTAVARGDLSRKITVDVKGKFSNSRIPSILWWTSLTPLPVR